MGGFPVAGCHGEFDGAGLRNPKSFLEPVSETRNLYSVRDEGFLSEAESYLKTAQLSSSVTAELLVEIRVLPFKAGVGKFDLKRYLLFLFFSNLVTKKEHRVRKLRLVEKVSLRVES